ncbi:hypothetical protein HOLleu_05915 [Holothuria leucospilota]|uniref:Uncharacterized protein n=1 Tax=Holothuria leucospilota TaxID=206669 RepID=A0A9Q1CLN9_HOLLE|nr:hypothetical protein HOLleu_05915 [Holothuria leucospilota]
MEQADFSGGYSVVEDGEVVGSPQCEFDDIVSNIFREHKPEENQFDDILDGVVQDLEIDKKGPGLSKLTYLPQEIMLKLNSMYHGVPTLRPLPSMHLA